MSNNREVRLRRLTFAQLHASVETKLPRALAADPLITAQVIHATIEGLGLQVDEASGEVIEKAQPGEWQAPEDNYRKSVRVPGRRR